MKILFITSHITSKEHPEFLRNQTGFGYMVKDIAKYVSKHNEISVDTFVANAMTPDLIIDDFNIIGRSWISWLRGVNTCVMRDSITFLKEYRLPIKRALRTLYMYLSIGQVEHIIHKYDIVHIHGCSELTDATIKVCKRNKKPFLVTLHGLNSFEESIKLPLSLKRYERDFLKQAAKNCYPVSFISSGNKETAMKSTGYEKVDSFVVINNGCNTQQNKTKADVRLLYSIDQMSFIFVYVGNVSQNKNQIQVARAWNHLSAVDKKNSKVLFVGNYDERDEIVQYIKDNHLEKNLILCGKQPKENVAAYYEAANATILTSKTEGFGLSIIEGYVYGKPCITYADLPATIDLYSSESMILSEGRNDIQLAKAMSKAMHTIFNKDAIIQYSKKFSFEAMAQKYVQEYKKNINI